MRGIKVTLRRMSTKDTYEYLNQAFTQSQDWYSHYGTLPSTKLYTEYFSFMKMNEAQSVLETGSGPGNGVPEVLKVAPQAQITVSDISEGFLESLRQIPASNLRVQKANIEELPFEDNTFDRYFSNMAVHNVVDPKKPFTEALRVLQPGGSLGVSVFGNDFEKNTYMKLMKQFREFTNIPYHATILENLKTMGDPDTFRDLVRNAGFSRVISFGINTVYPYGTPEEAKDLYLTFPQFVDWMKQNPDRAQEFKEFVMGKLHEVLIQEGKPIGYEAIILVAWK